MYGDGENLDGAFAKDTRSSRAQWTGGTYYGNDWRRAATFDASRSNSIYTDNGKVYPASLALNFIIKT